MDNLAQRYLDLEDQIAMTRNEKREEQRKLLWRMHFVDKISYRDIGEAVGLSHVRIMQILEGEKE